MRTIYKYPLDITDVNLIGMPEGSKILTVQEQNDMLQLWAFVNTEKPIFIREIITIGTGFYSNYNFDELIYINTVQMSNNSLVWHLFEVINGNKKEKKFSGKF